MVAVQVEDVDVVGLQPLLTATIVAAMLGERVILRQWGGLLLGLMGAGSLWLVIKPGMPAEMFVRTGERSLLNYLFKPLLDRAGSALTEE